MVLGEPGSTAGSGTEDSMVSRRDSVERDGLVPGRDLDREAHRLDLRLDGVLSGRIAMDEEDALRNASLPRPPPLDEVAEPRPELRVVGVGAESVQRLHLAADLEVPTVDARMALALQQVRAERALALIADEQQQRPRILGDAREVMQHAAAGQHP